MIFQVLSKKKNAKKCVMLKGWMLILVFFLSFININAQYFGRNKPSYKNFEFKVYTTPNFEIYHYLNNDSLLDQLARACEEWYELHKRIFHDSIKDRNPIIFYENHADFQQTTAIMGEVGVGTGGVTEALKNRVIMPVAPTSSQTDHVLGHELVHAFQYNSIIRGDSTNMNSLRNLPLWMVEGMAEYLSIGSVDEHTAMWMRDAILNDDFPTLKEMTRNQKYFPYRYGQAFWAFVAKTWGDTIIVPLFVETAKFGYEEAIKRKIGLTAETFSGIWKSAMERYYTGIMTDTIDNPTGEKILFSGNAGNMNLSPSISPDGQYVVFLSERDVLSLDLFLANAENGKIIKKLSSTIHRNEIDALNYLESSGTWSPDSKKFAFSAFDKGKNKLLIIDIKKGKLVEEYNIPGILSFNNPAWSPDGESIVIAGLVDGINNLYRFHMNENRVEQITNDRYSYIQPSFSPDGKHLVFATDREPDETDISNTAFNIGIIDLEEKGNIRILPVFYGADNLNPVFASDGESVYFLSNRDGFRNLYRFHLETGKTYQMTRYMTGISGVTHYSPAISVARSMDIIS
ncbi:MAG: PD40 domain-containing protein, partial [Bacteroidales bacterium]|nr:PD40 domain-containing protein [Bacteroidales bacterium]